jgi:hypothetical protein
MCLVAALRGCMISRAFFLADRYPLASHHDATRLQVASGSEYAAYSALFSWSRNFTLIYLLLPLLLVICLFNTR